MALYDNLLTIGILGALVLIVYCRATKKTLIDLIKELREAFGPAEEVLEYE